MPGIILGNRRKGNGMNELSITCELTPDEIAVRRAALLPGLLNRAEERTTLCNGFRWRFGASSETLAAMVETINAERQCCRFLRFVLTVESGGGPIWLEITGPQGTTEFLESLFRV